MTPAIHGLWPALLLPVSTTGVLDTPRTIAHAQRLLAAGWKPQSSVSSGLAETVEHFRRLRA